MLKTVCAALLCAICIGGCASAPPATSGPLSQGSDILLPEIDIVTVKENSDLAIKIAQEAKLDVEVLNSRVTEINNQLLNFSEEMASVSASKIEELENKLTVLLEEVRNLYRDNDSLRARLKLAPRPGSKSAVLSGDGFGPSNTEQLLSLTPDERKYRQAQSFYNSGQYVTAVVTFKEALKLAPTGKVADDAAFWIGECYYKMGQYAYAVAHFKKVFSFSGSDKADDAQMRIAQSYVKLGDNQQASVEFRNLLKLYPQSEYSDEAKKALSQIE